MRSPAPCTMRGVNKGGDVWGRMRGRDGMLWGGQGCPDPTAHTSPTQPTQPHPLPLLTCSNKGACVRALVFINPGNPTGQCLTEANLRDLVRHFLLYILFNHALSAVRN